MPLVETVDPWLCDELRYELEGEKGTQQITEALQLENTPRGTPLGPLRARAGRRLAPLGSRRAVLQLENSRIVFKEFGHEKRLSELEKKRLLKLLNRKTQSTRDIWENMAAGSRVN